MPTKIIFLTLICTLFSVAPGAQADESLVLVTEADLHKWWAVTQKEKPHYPRGAFNDGKQGCAVVGFVIESDGTTSSHRVLFSHPDAAFDRAAINAYKKWRFEAAEANPSNSAVFTTLTASFTWVDKEENRPEVREQVADLCRREGDHALQNLLRRASQ